MDLFLCALPLGLSGIKILLHLLNFAILMGGMTLLLYKPILKFINKRQETINNQFKENEENKAKAEEMLKDYKVKLDKVDLEIDNTRTEAIKSITLERETILKAAQNKAEEIYKKAEEETASERIQAVSNLQNEVAEVAVTIASNILEREITLQEHEKLIDACIDEWSQND